MSVRYILFLTIATFWFGDVAGRAYARLGDAISMAQDSSEFVIPAVSDVTDSLSYSDSLQVSMDTLAVNNAADSLAPAEEPKRSFLEDKVEYSSQDSMIMEPQGKKLYLYGGAKVTYQDIVLTADYIELDLGNREVFSSGVYDSLGKAETLPKFVQGSQDFDSDSMRYNFETRAGLIYNIRTEEAEGYLHSEVTKRHPNEHIHMKNGKFTTCNADHPHFYLALTKGIVIPNSKIIAGYSYLVVADVPVKVAGLPFGFFPQNKEERASGILMPTWGNDASRGFFLRDFGWYQVLGQYADLSVRGDIYARGSWSLRTSVGYKWRYHFNGNFGFDYAITQDNLERDVPKRTDYKLKWSHRQDAKSNPTQTFSANVNFSSGKFDEEYNYNSNDYLNSTTSSSISFSKRWPGSPFNLSMSGNATQNRQTGKVDLSLPTGSFNMSSIYPFRNKNGSGKYKWYENISLSYSSSFKNKVSTLTEILTEEDGKWKENINAIVADSMQNGFQHRVPLSVNFKIGKMINIAPSMSYTGVVFTHHKEIADDPVYDSITGRFLYEETEIRGLKYEHALNPSISTSFNPKFYGMINSKKEDSYIEAIRHVMKPSVSASYTPDMSAINNTQYWDTITYIDANGEEAIADIYNWYEDELYSAPSSAGQSGSVRLSLNNNFEAKVRPKSDTTGESKKVSLLDNLNFSTSWNPFKDSLRWSSVRMVTGTKLFNKAVDVRLNGTFSPYATDPETGKEINQFYIMQEGGGLLRLTNLSVNTGFTLRSKQGSDKGGADVAMDDLGGGEGPGFQEDPDMIGSSDYTRSYDPERYVDFDVPWTIKVSHAWSYAKRSNADPLINHTLNLTGDISFTPNWKIGGQMNYDLADMKVSYTSLTVHRDLHCWEMHFTVIPFGNRKSVAFTIQAKASMLKDLKYDRKPDYNDRWLD